MRDDMSWYEYSGKLSSLLCCAMRVHIIVKDHSIQCSEQTCNAMREYGHMFDRWQYRQWKKSSRVRRQETTQLSC
jgi:hypothetical protein